MYSTLRTTLLLIVVLLISACSTASKTEIPAAPTSPTLYSAEAIVEAFYSDYLNYFEDPATGSFRNPLADRMYANRAYLTQDLINTIDSIIASFDDMGAYDPILCAQNIPDYITFGQPIINAGKATFMIETSFDSHYFFVHLNKEADGWKIDTISCNH